MLSIVEKIDIITFHTYLEITFSWIKEKQILFLTKEVILSNLTKKS